MTNTTTPTLPLPQVATVWVAPLSPEVIEAEMDMHGDTIRMQFDAGTITRRRAARMLLCGALGLDADEVAEDELAATPLDGSTTRYSVML